MRLIINYMDNLQKLKSYDDEWSDEAMKKFYKSKKLTII